MSKNDVRDDNRNRTEGRERTSSAMTRSESWPSTVSAGTPAGWFGSPFSMMNKFAEEMDRVFDSFGLGRGPLSSLRSWAGPIATTGIESAWPAIECFQRGDDLVVRADLPGLKKDDVRVEIVNDNLVIQGERKQEREERDRDFYRSERSYGSFYRAIPLPEGVQDKDVNASFEDGVLEVSMPAPPQQRPRRIEIREGSGRPKAQAATAGGGSR